MNQRLRVFRSKIIGEVSEVGFGPTGHVYFTLKDEKDQNILKCMMFKNKYDIYGIELKKGDTLILEEWNPKKKQYTGLSACLPARCAQAGGHAQAERKITKKVNYVLKFNLDDFGQKKEIKKKGLYVI